VLFRRRRICLRSVVDGGIVECILLNLLKWRLGKKSSDILSKSEDNAGKDKPL
jgi:hypothetical protein